MTTKKVKLTASEVLAKAKAQESELPSTTVERPLDQENDLGNLMGCETNDLDFIIEDASNSDSKDFEAKLKSHARDNVQFLFNEIWSLPTERVEDAIVAVLPPPSTVIPREKPLPKPKPMTKWEKYAKEKGIVKQKKTRKVWDDVVKEWVPRFGYKKAKAEAQKNWMMEYKEGQDEDPFEKAIEAKRERVAKNELQRLRNIARSKNTKVPGVGLTPTTPSDSQTSNDLKKASELTTKATASLGKFQENLPKSLAKNVKPTKGKKRKFESVVGEADQEKAKNMKVLEQVTSKQPQINVAKAVGRQINEEDTARSDEKKSRMSKQGKKKGAKKGQRPRRGGSGGGGGGGGKGQFKSKGGPGGKAKGRPSGGRAGKVGGKKSKGKK